MLGRSFRGSVLLLLEYLKRLNVRPTWKGLMDKGKNSGRKKKEEERGRNRKPPASALKRCQLTSLTSAQETAKMNNQYKERKGSQRGKMG